LNATSTDTVDPEFQGQLVFPFSGFDTRKTSRDNAIRFCVSRHQEIDFMAQSASFYRGGFRSNGSLLLAVATTSALLLGGCDTDTGRADKKVAAQVYHATHQFGDSEADWALSNKELNDAVRESTASLPRQLQAKTQLADSELQMAQLLAKQVLTADARIDRLSSEIIGIGDSIDANNQMATVLAKYDPTDLQAKITANAAEVAGTDASSVWAPTDSSKLPALSANTAQAGVLNKTITDLQADIKAKSDQRNQLLDQSDKLIQQSQHEKKDKSVDLFTQGSKARKDAADLTVALDQQNQKLAQAQSDLAVLTAEQTSLSAAQQVLTDKAAAVTTSWNSIKDEQAALNKESAALLGDDPVDPPLPNKNGDLKTEPTIGSKAAAIIVLFKGNPKTGLKGAASLRSEAEMHFNSAIGFYKDATDLATKIQSELGDKTFKADPEKPDQLAWADEQKALDPSTYRYLQADAEMQKADVFSQSVHEAAVRLMFIDRIAAVGKGAQLTLYPNLEDTDQGIVTQKQKAIVSAREAYTNALDLLSKVAEGTAGPDEKSAAQVETIFAQYGWYLLETAAGDAQAAANHLTQAKTAVTAATAAGTELPTLPAELVVTATPAMPGGVSSPGMSPRVPR
jgi:hypothetical protein